jgi:hypothetical protein
MKTWIQVFQIISKMIRELSRRDSAIPHNFRSGNRTGTTKPQILFNNKTRDCSICQNPI